MRNVQTLAEAVAVSKSFVEYKDSRKDNKSGGSKGKGLHKARECQGRQKLNAIIASGCESKGDEAQMRSLRIVGIVKVAFKVEKGSDVDKVSTLPRPKGTLRFVEALVNGKASRALVDTGASHNLIAKEEASKLGVNYAKKPGTLKTINASPMLIPGVSKKVPRRLGGWSGTVDLTIVNMDDFSLVLGLEFMDSMRSFAFERDRSMSIVKDYGEWSVPITREEVEAKIISAILLKKGQATFLATLVEDEPHGGEVLQSSPKCLKTFDDLKCAVTEEPTLALSDYSKSFELHTNASNFSIKGVLMQERHPVAYEFHKLNDTEKRYTKKLSPKQARGQDILAEFDYTIEYKPSKVNVVADALSRKAILVSASSIPSNILRWIKEDGLSMIPWTRGS
uniref:Reverse transcriptase/retrotransposon-derived protein RNase H-like domain-containing protein n=1 Tax=Chenopodium quinoa TaxID=63459 RepID=A0A803N1F8_CHEQI